MFAKIKIHLHEFIKRCTDVRYLGQVGFVIVVLLVSWSGIKSIQTNYELQKKVDELVQENEVERLKNDNLKIQNKYYETEEFLELAARRQFGKAAPGEKVVAIPTHVALGYTKDIAVQTKESARAIAESEKPFYQRNLEAWGRFFFPTSQD